MSAIRATLALNLDANLLLASLPLLEQEQVQAVEWSFDALFRKPELPEWFSALIEAFSAEHRLIGHGIFFSLFSGKWQTEQSQWLKKLDSLSQQYNFDHISEHFGFTTGENFHKGAPMPVPLTPQSLAIGQDRLMRIQDACKCPVGLENLAFVYSVEQAKQQGDFLEKLLLPVNGFLILDLHNLYCQLHNFGLSFEELIAFYPLERVREIHISGGSWEDSKIISTQKIRRDTHDSAVPSAVFELLEKAISLCPNLKYVVLEQMGTSLETEVAQAQFRQDFLSLSAIVEKNQRENEGKTAFLPPISSPLSTSPLEDLQLYAEQIELSSILENAVNYESALGQLANSSLAQSAWQCEKWQPYMLETAISIAQKWKEGWK